jgi:hypothetical protein
MRASAHQQDLLVWLAPEMSFVDEPLRCGPTERLSDHRGTLSRWNHDDLRSRGGSRCHRPTSAHGRGIAWLLLCFAHVK